MSKNIDENYSICSGCNTPQITVSRDLFDGLCVKCTEKALYDLDFAKKARLRNLLNHITVIRLKQRQKY